MAWKALYLHERLAFEVASGAQAVQHTRLTKGKAIAEPDSPATTEACWYARVLRWRLARMYPKARVDVKVVWLEVADPDAPRTWGIGLEVAVSALDWFPDATYAIVLFVSRHDGTKFLPTENPL